MITPVKAPKRVARWATCPVCFRVRRYTTKGVMVNHRVWVSGFNVNGDPNHPDSHPYGYMKPCKGSGQPPLEEKEENNGSAEAD